MSGSRNWIWVLILGLMWVGAGCMSVLHYHEIDGVTKSPFSGTKTDLGLVATAVSDPELRGTLPGFALFTMSAFDTPFSFVADAVLLPRDLRRSAAPQQPPNSEQDDRKRAGD